MVMFWIGLIIVLLLIEVATVGLTTIWFAGGALVALIACGLGFGIIWQVALFFAVSLVLLFFTRPLAMKYLSPHKIRTNYEDAVGKTVQITEQVNNHQATGVAILNGQEWTARSTEDDIVLETGGMGQVVAVEGVKLIIKEAKQQKEK